MVGVKAGQALSQVVRPTPCQSFAGGRTEPLSGAVVWREETTVLSLRCAGPFRPDDQESNSLGDFHDGGGQQLATRVLLCFASNRSWR